MKRIIVASYIALNLFLSVPSVLASDFPRNDGNHFTFETNWECRTEVTGEDSLISSSFAFSIHNLNSSITVQFKRLSLDTNDCYNNNSWNVTLTLSDEKQIISTMNITDYRSEPIEVKTDNKYWITLNTAFNTSLLTDGKYYIIIQLNVMDGDIDEPHYFFKVLEYSENPKEKDAILLIPIWPFAIALTILLLISLWNWKRKR